MKKISLIALLLLNTGIANAAVDTASWTNWATGPGANGTFTQNGNIINVTYTGNYGYINHVPEIFNFPSSFISPMVTNTPGSNGSIVMTGGSGNVANTIHFSQAVIDPLIAMWSVGQGGVPVTFNFLDNPTFSILSQGTGFWGGGTLAQTGYSVTGNEGNGVIQFKGSFTDINFTTPDYENYYGFTTGALITAVPEPETYALFFSGLGLMGLMARRRKEN